MNHKLISLKLTENKYERDSNGNLTSPNCPLCKHHKETRDHYSYECSVSTTFRQNIAKTVDKTDFIKQEWNLEKESATEHTTIIIAKARWALHCERCNIDHNRKKIFHQKIVLKRTQSRMDIAVNTHKKTITHKSPTNNTTHNTEKTTNLREGKKTSSTTVYEPHTLAYRWFLTTLLYKSRP